MARLIKALIAAAVVLALPTSVLAQDATADPASAEQGASFLAVVSGSSGSMDAKVLTLDGVDGILVFTDRPERQAFLAPLAIAEGSQAEFAGDPPNAVLSVLAGESVENTVVVLTEVVGVGETSLTLAYSLVEGDPPDGTFGPASLFIDQAAPVVVDALCASVDSDPANEPAAVVDFCANRS